jgi:hydroxymethylpyrimidine pyrophosphatase-like HAD family hydrolase
MGEYVNINDDSRDVIFIDLDGTLVKHNYNPSQYPENYLSGTLQYLIKNKDKAIILTTSRRYAHIKKIIDFLTINGILIHNVLCDLPTGKRILINDHKSDSEEKAIAINVIRDIGIE